MGRYSQRTHGLLRIAVPAAAAAGIYIAEQEIENIIFRFPFHMVVANDIPLFPVCILALFRRLLPGVRFHSSFCYFVLLAACTGKFIPKTESELPNIGDYVACTTVIPVLSTPY